MKIKRSAKVGGALNRLLEGASLTGEQIAEDLNVSAQLVSHMKTDRRNMQVDVAQDSMVQYDCPEYTMDILHEFSSKFTSPVFRGKFIDQHRMAMEENAVREFERGIEIMRRISLAKPPSMLDSNERQDMMDYMDEIIEARVHADNLLKQLQLDYGISIMDRIKALIPRWKAKGWLE